MESGRKNGLSTGSSGDERNNGGKSTFSRKIKKKTGEKSRFIIGKSPGQILLFYKRNRIIWRITIFCQSKKYLDSINKSLIDCFDFSPVLLACLGYFAIEMKKPERSFP
ncbi:hypothetical protein [Oribacterium sinus]|uniref:hypothetical protein n=1 Tax=Oribacterium sinus TaxID=237576 RepID=UPI0028E25F48|nr:hypothetical protein [Oribacterium sinus]